MSAVEKPITNNIEIGSLTDKTGQTTEVCFSQPIAILDVAGEKSGWNRQIVSKVNSLNGNQRIYPKEVYGPALDKLKARGFPYAGEHPHPPSYKGRDGRVYFKTSVPNSAVSFRDAYIDAEDNVWAEYRTLETEMGRQVQSLIDAGLPIGFSNRMTGVVDRRTFRDCAEGTSIVEVARELELYTWDVLLNAAEEAAFSRPVPITDEIKLLLENENEEVHGMGFFGMPAEELKAQKLLLDEVSKLPYEQKVKDAIIKRGAAITDAAEVSAFVDAERALIDAVAVSTKLKSLGADAGADSRGRAVIIETSERNPAMAIVDGLMAEMDREMAKKDVNFKADKKLRNANTAILDAVLRQFERDDAQSFAKFTQALKDEAARVEITDGVATSPALSTSGEFAQAAHVSLAILRQAWQDLKFLQICMVEGFEGSTYKMPVEWQSSDLFSEDDFCVGELDGVPTESVQTFFLEFGAEWLKRGFVVTKEAKEALETGPFKYNIIGANAASIAARFSRIIDNKISTEMLARSDEYAAKQVTGETPADTEIEAVTAGVSAPASTNAEYKVRLLCGHSSPLSSKMIPPVVRPRVSQWLDVSGRLQKRLINEIIVIDSGGNMLTQGLWNANKGMIVPAPGKANADYAVDFENAEIYFAEGVMSPAAKPTVEQYSYATNIAFFDLTVPPELKDFEARYYNKLLELIDRQQAYMGSAPRYVSPDFLLGSLSAMVPYRQAELFYKRALPDGTSLLGGEMYFGRRNGVELGAHNAPWAAGDGRLLLGKTNATRVGIGSSFEMEGPFPHVDKNTGNYTTAKVWNATQQIAVCTPLVVDGDDVQYHPPFRTIKYYNS